MSPISSKRKDKFSVFQDVAAMRLRTSSFLHSQLTRSIYGTRLWECYEYGNMQSSKLYLGGDTVSFFLLQQKHLVSRKLY